MGGVEISSSDGTIRELGILLEIPRTQPKAAYSAIITRCYHKATYYMRIITREVNTTSTSRPNDSGRIHTIHHWRNNLQERREKVTLTPA